MKIEKEYDVQELANKLKEKIEKCRNCGTKHVGIDIITAQEIVDVLEVIASWENKRTKLRDIRERLTKQNCFGTYDDSTQCKVCECKEDCEEATEIEDDETEDFV